MIPATFNYVKANTIEEAVKLLQESNGEGKVIAGGHSLLPLMKFRITEPEQLIDVSSIDALKGVRLDGDNVIVGAMTTHFETSTNEIINEHIPVLAEAASVVGDIQIRNRGTIGGNLAHGDPVADLTAPALALEAELKVHTEDGIESIPYDGFTLGPLITTLPENGVIESVSFKIPPAHTKSVYLKFFHPATGYPVIGVAAIAGVNDRGEIDFVRVGITGVGEVAFRAISTENALLGKTVSDDAIKKAAALALDDGEMGSDLFASEKYRENLTKVYTERALRKVLL